VDKSTKMGVYAWGFSNSKIKFKLKPKNQIIEYPKT